MLRNVSRHFVGTRSFFKRSTPKIGRADIFRPFIKTAMISAEFTTALKQGFVRRIRADIECHSEVNRA